MRKVFLDGVKRGSVGAPECRNQSCDSVDRLERSRQPTGRLQNNARGIAHVAIYFRVFQGDLVRSPRFIKARDNVTTQETLQSPSQES